MAAFYCLCSRTYHRTVIQGVTYCTNCGHPVKLDLEVDVKEESDDIRLTAADAVIEYINKRVPSELSSLFAVRVALDEVQIVEATQVLSNWMVLIRTTLEDNCLFAVTFGGDAEEVKVDVYRKIDQVALQRAELFPGE